MARLIKFFIKVLVFALLIQLVCMMWSCRSQPKYKTAPPVVKRGGPRFK
jgi:hypothetical protein